jgi:hypothetical protein
LEKLFAKQWLFLGVNKKEQLYVDKKHQFNRFMRICYGGYLHNQKPCPNSANGQPCHVPAAN